MKFQFKVNGTVLFETNGGNLLVTKDVLRIAGFEGGFDNVEFSIVDGIAVLDFGWNIHSDLTERERTLIANNQQIHAIKEVRARTGLSLKEAKNVTDIYKAQIDPDFAAKFAAGTGLLPQPRPTA